MRILQTGFELQNIATEFSSTLAESTATITIVTTNPRSGAAHLFINRVSGANSVYGIKSLGASYSEIYIRFGLYINSFAPGSTQTEIMSLWDSGVAHLFITLNANQQLAIYRSTTLLATSAIPISTSVWTLVEFHFTIADVGGVIQIKQNGITTIDTTADTRNAGNASVNTIYLGESETISTSSSKHVYGIYIDDLAINSTSGSSNNSWIGDGGIVLIKPDGNGSLTQLSRGGTDSGANWSQVNDVPHNGTVNTVYANAAGSADLYSLANPVITLGAISAIRWISMSKEDTAGGGSVSRYIKSNGTAYEGSVFGLTASGSVFTEFSEIIETNPSTSVAFTASEINSLEAGVMTR